MPTFSDSILTQVAKKSLFVVDRFIDKVSHRYSIPKNELKHLLNRNQNPYLNFTPEHLRKQIHGLFPYIFCDSWSHAKCATFLREHETTEEYQLHPLYYRFRSLSVAELQQMTGRKDWNDRDALLEDLVRHSGCIYENERDVSQYNYFATKEIRALFVKHFPGFPIPEHRNDMIHVLCSF